MYASGYMGHYSDFETYQSILVSDPESSSVIDSEEETTEEDSPDVAEEGETNDSSEGSSHNRDAAEDSEVSAGSSGSDSSVDHNDDSSDMLSGGWDHPEEEASEGSDAGSGTESGSDSGDPEDGSYEVIIRGDSEHIEELYRFLNGENEDAGSDFDKFESDGDEYNRELDNGDTEYVEYDSAEYPDESGDSESSTESSTRLPEDSSDADEFYLRNIELLGIIAGCLYFIVFVIILKYIYKFFRLFI